MSIATDGTTLNEFQARCLETRRQSARGLLYGSIALAGETGEFCNKVKRVLEQTAAEDADPSIHQKLQDYTEGEYSTTVSQADLVDELGDVLWNTASLAEIIGVSLEDVADALHAKLSARTHAEPQVKLKPGI